jgi:phosphatidylglycerophosphatase A
MKASGPAAETGASIPWLSKLIATGLYTGFSPWASGTVGTLLGLAIAILPGVHTTLMLGILIVVGFFAGVKSARDVAEVVGHQLTAGAAYAKATFQEGSPHSTPDPSIVVIDEIVGMWITLLFVPHTVVALAIAFVAFRVMDIVKPEPAGRVERFGGGWGIMLDDAVAAIYANIVTQILVRVVIQRIA